MQITIKRETAVSQRLSNFALLMYKHLTQAQRYYIYVERQKGSTQKSIAEAIGVSEATVSRELKRNGGRNNSYNFMRAQEKADSRCHRTPGNRAVSETLKWRVRELLTKEQWSPKQIAGRLRLEGHSISHETVYAMIRADKTGELAQNCRHKMKYDKKTSRKHETKATNIKNRVSNLEALMAQMNTKLSKVSALADAVEKGLYITQVKTTADGYELTLSNGKIIILQNTSDNWLVPTPAVSMTQISGLYYWTLNGLLFTDSDGKPVRSSGKAPIVKYDYTLMQWVISIDGGVTFTNVNEMTGIIINDTVLMQIINDYVKRNSSTIITQQMLFQIISTYIQRNYAELFSAKILDQVVVNYVDKHWTRLFSYELMEKIFTQYNFSYYTSQIDVDVLIEAIVTYIRENNDIFLNNEVLYEIISNYIEVNKTTIFDTQMLVEVISNFLEKNENFIDIELLTQVVHNYIDQHQDVIFDTETVVSLIREYVKKYYTEVFSQNILIQVINTYVTTHSETIFNKTVIEEVINQYLKNDFYAFISKETIHEIVNNYVKVNGKTIINRDVLVEIISNYFEKNYSLFISKEDISTVVNDYIDKHRTTLIDVDIIEHIVYNFLEKYYVEVFSKEMLSQVIVNYFETNRNVVFQKIFEGVDIIREVKVEDDLCTVTLSNGEVVSLVVYDAMARLRDRVQSIVVLPNASGRADYDKWHNEVNLRCLVSPSAMASVIEEKCRKDEMSMELVVTDGTSGFVDRVPVTYYSSQDGILTVGVSSLTDIKAVALHIKENKTGATDIMTEFIPVGEESQQKGYLECPDSHHPHLIDLGLPSGTKWACCNVGASAPEQYGSYFAWGETSPKSIYSWNTYQYGYYNYDGDYSHLVNIGSDIAGTQYDAATVNWGNPWVMPNKDQMYELVNSCTSEWTTENGVNGRKFTGPSGGTIFLPAAGLRWRDDLGYAGSYGYYWSSTLRESYSYGAWYLLFLSGDVHADGHYRDYGPSVRPVRKN